MNMVLYCRNIKTKRYQRNNVGLWVCIQFYLNIKHIKLIRGIQEWNLLNLIHSLSERRFVHCISWTVIFVSLSFRANDLLLHEVNDFEFWFSIITRDDDFYSSASLFWMEFARTAALRYVFPPTESDFKFRWTFEWNRHESYSNI